MKLKSSKWDFVFIVVSAAVIILLNYLEVTRPFVGSGAFMLVFVAYLIGRLVGQGKEDS